MSVVAILAVGVVIAGIAHSEPYYGVKIGRFSTHFHEVTGDVYAVDDKTIFIRNFNYDGKGPDTFFWAGNSIRPDTSGFIIPNEKGSTEPLPAYKTKDVLLRLPDGKRVQDLRWLAVWCRRFRANFGSLIFPRNLKVPEPVEIGALSSTKQGVSTGPIVVLDSQTFLVPEFNFEGKEKAFWWVSQGPQPNNRGLRLPDEKGSNSPLKRYSRQTIVISIPEEKSVYDYDWLSIWNADKSQDLGHVKIPKESQVPPSPRALGFNQENKLNCEVLDNDIAFEVRWVLDKEDILIQLVGKIENGEYMAFGLSRDDTETKMVNADAVVSWMDKNGLGHAVDYFLGAMDTCKNNQGTCPDRKLGKKNSVTLLNAAAVNGYTMLTFRRPARAEDPQVDQNIYSDGPQAVLWAVGPVNEKSEIGYHRLRTKGNLLMDFGRPPKWNCPPPDDEVAASGSEEAPVKSTPEIVCPIDRVFRMQIGPSHAYKEKQDSDNRLLSWYINGLAAPDITVQRGKTYIFLVEGGRNPNSPTRYHPLYITDSAEGGIHRKSPPQGEIETVYTGITKNANGQSSPTAAGRLCEWSYSPRISDAPEASTRVGIQDVLELKCEPGEPAQLEWTPEGNTPDLLYYQSFSHFNMGGKIHVVDACVETSPLPYLMNISQNIHHHGEREREEGVAQIASSDFEGQISGLEKLYFVDGPGGSGGHLEKMVMQEPSFPQDVQERVVSKTQASPPAPPHIYYHLQSGGDVTTGAMPIHPPQSSNDDLNKVSPPPFTRNTIPLPLRPQPTGHRPPVQQVANRIPIQPGSVDENFNIRYEGGFVPLFVQNEHLPTHFPDPTTPPPGPLRPFPFGANDSIPFHGSFKPGKPDFSGFNISSYRHTSTPTPAEHKPQNKLPSAPTPQIIQQPSNQGNNLPPQYFLRPHGGLPQRRPTIHLNSRPPHLGSIGNRRPPPPGSEPYVYVQLPPQQYFPPGYYYPRPLEEDLSSLPSQRVMVSHQTPEEEKIQGNVYQHHRQKVRRKPGPHQTPYQRGVKRPQTVNKDRIAMSSQPQMRPFNYPPFLHQGESEYYVLPPQMLQRPGQSLSEIDEIMHLPSNVPYGARLRPSLHKPHPRAPQPLMAMQSEQNFDRKSIRKPDPKYKKPPMNPIPDNKYQGPHPIKKDHLENSKLKDINEKLQTEVEDSEEDEEDEDDEDEDEVVEEVNLTNSPELVLFPHAPVMEDIESGFVGSQEAIVNSENIKLPQIPGRAPHGDNTTDYSILSHVLTLIKADDRTLQMAVPRSQP